MWVKVSDDFFRNPVIAALTKDAKLLYLAGLTHCAEQLSDGNIDGASVKLVRAMVKVGPKAVTELVEAGRWVENGARGYRVHDWQDYNPPAAKVKAEREAARKRMKSKRNPNEIQTKSTANP